jgi:hypothetical protein
MLVKRNTKHIQMKLNYFLLLAAFLGFMQATQAQFSILLVNDNANDTQRYLEIDTTLANLAYDYEIYNTVETGTYPDLSIIAPHDVIIWYTGNDGVDLKLWDVSNTADYKFNEPLLEYLNNGGIVWVQGLDFFYDVYGAAPDYFTPGQFVYDYMGVSSYFAQSYSDDGGEGVPQLDVVPGNELCDFSPVQWVYATMWYADALEISATSQGIYKMGPQGYVLESYYAGVYNVFGNSKIFTFTVETARINTEENTDTLFSQVLSYFESISGGDILVTDITVSTEGGATTISENGGTLQMLTDVEPPDATNPNVYWSVIDGSGTANINQSGLLQSTGTSIGNGTVWVKALAVDGSGISDSVQISITNQGADFEILLVNDNDLDANRYKEIDTTLVNLGCAYDIYNTVTTQNFPDALTLSAYEMVIWYTGNDGVDLYLWDISDTNNYKFNAPLVDYLNNGGIVWLQGLDFFYDIYGLAPDYFEAGQFIYDYMGVSSYSAQSYTDDGNLGLPQLDVVPGNGICTFAPVRWVYETLYYADAIEITTTSNPVYKMGPVDYVLSDYYAGVYNEFANAKILTFTVETARIDTEINTDTIFSQVITYFENYSSGDILVEDINVSGEGGATSISENGGSLQMIADVLPENATNPNVYWSVSNQSGMASIDQTGLLQASGTSIGNGTVYVKALALDGSGVADSIQIIISNQGAAFEILLVNDNDYDANRYLELDSTLMNLAYSYDIYNTVTTHDFPDANTLSYYEMVIWYTGNDGVDLHLWDVSDTNNYKFNEPLIQYLDNGGTVWLQGLDFFYDILGAAPDSFVENQFIYDYLGVSSYAAQTYADDGSMGVPQLDVVPDNPICTFTPVQWVYATMWYADAIEITSLAHGIYTMGPEGYVFDNYYAGVFNEKGSAKLLTFTVETARIDTEEHTDDLFFDVIEYFRLWTDIAENANISEPSIEVFPNPATEMVSFSASLDETTHVGLSITDLSGRKIFSKKYGTRPAGTFNVEFPVKDYAMPAGIYFYTLELNSQQFNGKLIITNN